MAKQKWRIFLKCGQSVLYRDHNKLGLQMINCYAIKANN